MVEVTSAYQERRHQVLTAERVHRAVDVLLENADSANEYTATLAKTKLGELLDVVEGVVSVDE